MSRHWSRVALIGAFAALLSNPATLSAAGFAPSLGLAAHYAALAGGPAAGAVTCTDSTVFGDVGVVFPGTFVGTANCTLLGTLNNNATAAYADFLAAYNALQFNAPCDQTLTGTLAGVTLSPGVYCFTAAATLTGTLTLNGPADGVWIFKIGTGGTGALTGTNFSVVMASGGQPSNVFWAPSTGASMTTSLFQGNILAGDVVDGSITLTGGTLVGRALANVAVTMTSSSVIGQ